MEILKKINLVKLNLHLYNVEWKKNVASGLIKNIRVFIFTANILHPRVSTVCIMHVVQIL